MAYLNSLQVILKAAHLVANRDCSARLCGVLLSIMNCLLDLNITKQKDPTQPPQSPIAPLKDSKGSPEYNKGKKTDDKSSDGKRDSTDSSSDGKKEEKSSALVAMETLVR